ncbi:MAG: hypothetical protein Q7T81_00560 [Pseudolabrys sp.]|nr:hypothetical protein [Pseudolabrys sp.]
MIACTWTAAQGLGLVRLYHAESSEPDTLSAREERLVQQLSVRPGAPAAWLSLAVVRHGLGEPQEKIDAAFMMSSVTGPAEGAVMSERALLGLLLWESSSVDVQARTMTDLCGLTVFDPWKLRLVMTTKTAAVQAALRAGLEAQGCTPALIRNVGL